MEDDFAQDRYAALVAHVRALDKMDADLDPVAFLKTIRNARHMASTARSGRNIAFKVTYVIEAVMFCQLLHDAGTMRKALKRAAVLALPECLRNDVDQLLRIWTILQRCRTKLRFRAGVSCSMAPSCSGTGATRQSAATFGS